MIEKLDKLEMEIEALRLKMFDYAKKYSLHSEQVVAVSKRLDVTLNQYAALTRQG